MSMQKRIVVLDANPARKEQLATVLSFIGEQFELVELEAFFQHPLPSEDILSVVVAGEISEKIAAKIKQTPRIPFILFDVIDYHPVNGLINVIGSISTQLNYAKLTELIHHCHQYHNKLPSRKAKNANIATLFKSLIGASQPMQQVRFLIEQVARTQANVLVLGESGTGKEVVARNIHDLSDRAKAPFVPVNCGAIPGELLESELFGHEKGAFTGAISARKGRFELAEGGTLFLDEIGDMPHPMQVKLLRVLQERTFERVGGSKSLKANVRIIAATHQHLEKMIKEGKFREDLFYRLNVFPIETPALRERKEDVPLILHELVSRFEKEQGQGVKFTERALESLMEHPWSGNVRELSNLIERMIIMYAGQTVDVAELPLKYQHIDVETYQPEYPEELQEKEAINELFAGFDYDEDDDNDTEAEKEQSEERSPSLTEQSIDTLPENGIVLKDYLAELEVSFIQQALERHDWVVAHACETLGMRRTTLVEKMRKYKLQKNDD